MRSQTGTKIFLLRREHCSEGSGQPAPSDPLFSSVSCGYRGDHKVAGRNYTEEVGCAMKTMAIRVEDELHARLALLARLNNRSLADELLEAVTTHLETKWSDEALTSSAEAALADIDREAATRRQAIESLLRPGEGKTSRKGKR